MTDILDCGHKATPTTGITNGIARYFDADGVERTCCFACAAQRLKAKMKYSGMTDSLYLTLDKRGNGEVTDWTGLLKFRVAQARIGKHNMVGKRYDVWFHDEDGRTWWGVTYGDNTQVCHCRRIKVG